MVGSVVLEVDFLKHRMPKPSFAFEDWKDCLFGGSSNSDFVLEVKGPMRCSDGMGDWGFAVSKHVKAP